ncbi:uncharacterized protein LOC124208800 isoform X2 [Daphnia pulex]|nr:uncharacterized protein LOC124208800 isoform X2 [Daphnia pulex]
MCYGRDVSHDENEKVQCNSKNVILLDCIVLSYSWYSMVIMSPACPLLVTLLQTAGDRCSFCRCATGTGCNFRHVQKQFLSRMSKIFPFSTRLLTCHEDVFFGRVSTILQDKSVMKTGNLK